MTKYELYLAIHLVAIVAWVGGGLTVSLLLTRLFRAGDMTVYGVTAQNVGFIAQRLYTTSSLVALVTGILLTNELNVNIYEPWVLFGLLVLIASAVVGATFLGPNAERAGEMIASGASPDELKAQFEKVITVNRIELVFLFLVVVDMVVKPGWP